jgi:YHS domain-containing protein
MTTTPNKDPVCGMNVEPAADVDKSTYKGQAYFFCCPGCKMKFDQSPEEFHTEPEPTPKPGKGSR